jgi:hypothetical protein
MAKRKTDDAIYEEDGRELPEADDGAKPDSAASAAGSSRTNRTGWHPERQRHPRGVRGSDLSSAFRPEDLAPQKSSESYLDVEFGHIGDDVPGQAANAARDAVEHAKRAWSQVDQARPALLSNVMQTREARLDELDRLNEGNRASANQALDNAVQAVEKEIEAADWLTKNDLKPTKDEAPVISVWASQLSSKSGEELHTIVANAIEDGQWDVLKATLGSPDWLVPLGQARRDMLMAQLENKRFDGRAQYRERLKQVRDQLKRTRQVATRHFDNAIDPMQRADLEKARQSAAAAAKVRG